MDITFALIFCAIMREFVLKKYGWIGILLSVFVGLFLLLQLTSAYHFFYVEQYQVFLYSSDFARSVIFDIGGVAAYVSVFLLQFFAVPYGGALICAFLLTGVVAAAGYVVRKLLPAYHSFILFVSPLVGLLFIQMDLYYSLQGTVAYLFCLLALDLYVSVKNRPQRLLAGFFLVPALFYTAGPVSVLFVVCAVVFDVFLCGNRNTLSFAGIAGLLVFGVLFPLLSIYLMQIGSLRMAFLPDFYYNSSVKPMWNIYLSWVVFPLGLLFIPLLKGIKRVPAIGLWCGVQAIVIAIVVTKCVLSYFYLGSNAIKEINYYAYTQNWDGVIQKSFGKITDKQQLNYLNLALSQKGLLADYMFRFDQRGEESLIKKFEYNDDYAVLSDCYFNIGAIAKSQHQALSANVASGVKYNNPRMLQRMVQCSLVLGEYRAAEKLLLLLEKTLFYRDWAQQYRKFLNNDEAILADSELGDKRRAADVKKDYSFLVDVKAYLRNMLEDEPSNKKYMTHLGCEYLLDRDIRGFKEFIETYFGTETLPVLPRSFQEAVLIYAETDPEYWEKYGVDLNIIEKHKQYKHLYLSNKNSPNLKGMMYKNFGDTYWYYMMFKN